MQLYSLPQTACISEKPMGWSYLKAGTIGGEQFQELRDFNNTKFSYLK